MTNPERFRPLHAYGDALLARLERQYDVAREEGYGLDPELEAHELTRPLVRLVPKSEDAGALTMAFTSFPGLLVRLGHWSLAAAPGCGCDACDETAEGEWGELQESVDALVHGSYVSWVELGSTGDGRSGSELPGSSGWSMVERQAAQAMIHAAGGRKRFEYAPWPRRS